MSLSAHYETLCNKHAKIEQEIQSAYAAFSSDDYIQSLKRQKLKLKEEIAKLEQDEQLALQFAEA
jgi:hypothetical protein